MKSYKIDLHTHSVKSPDGSITVSDYEKALHAHLLDYVAITDHNAIDYALFCQKKLGEQIIIGEEINTKQGHVIGLFLKKIIEKDQDIEKTIELIKEQNGLVYIPHPFDTFRNGIGKKNLLLIKETIDIIESFNARVIFAWQNNKALEFTQKEKIIQACGSDAHSATGLGKTYTIVTNTVASDTLKQALRNASFHAQYLSFFDYLTPKINRIKKYVTF